MEQDEGVGPEVGSSGKSCWRHQVGWIPPVAAEIQDSRSGRWLRRIPLLTDIEDLGDSDTFESNNIDKEGGDVSNSLSDPKMLSRSGFARLAQQGMASHTLYILA